MKAYVVFLNESPYEYAPISLISTDKKKVEERASELSKAGYCPQIEEHEVVV